jgi:hypothetical protein
MCSSACKRARPGTPCHCDCRRWNHGKWYGRRSYSRSYYRTPRVVVRREHSSPRFFQSERLPQFPQVDHSVGRQILKSAVIGVSCAAFPGACPAIVAFGKLTDVYNTAREIVNRIRSDHGGVHEVAKSVAGHLVAEAATHMVGPWTRVVSDGIASRIPAIGLSQTSVRSIVSTTVSSAMSEGFDGLASWGVGNQ